MSANVSSLSASAACEPDKLIVQVVGKDHSDSQRLVIYDETDQVQQEWLSNQDKPEVLTSEAFSSVLHVWDWEGQPKRHLWLEIAASEGDAIRVPLLDDVHSTPRQDDQQWNQIVPVVPMTPLPGSKSTYDLGSPVVVRSGYVYVFYRSKLWRELEVCVSDDGTHFRDINVARYRQGDGFKSGQRRATGIALDDIWLPACWNDWRTLDVQLGYAEVQLSAARLKRLEADPELRRKRFKSFDLQASKAKFKQLYDGQPNGQDMLDAFSMFNVRDPANQADASKARVTHGNIAMHVFPASLAAPQRARQPGYEWLLDHPGRYICDLSGRFPASSKSAAQAFSDSCEHGTPVDPGPLLETGAFEHCMDQTVRAQSSSHSSSQRPADMPAADSTELWQAQAASDDVLQGARGRQICAVLLDDSVYRMRHLKQRIDTQQSLLQLCAKRATLNPHHGSALLVQQLIVPRAVAGQANPLSEAMGKLKETGKRDLNRFTALPERFQVWRHLNGTQELLADCLRQARHQQALADHLSLDGFDYLSEMHFTSQLIASLATTPGQLDPLAVSGKVTDAISAVELYSPTPSPAQKFISRIASEQTHPLHAMLWPLCKEEELLAPYQAPINPQPNDGDGAFRGSELARYETLAPPSGSWQTLNSEIVAGLLAAGSLNSALTGSGKSTAGALMNMLENFQGAIEAAQSALRNAHEASQRSQATAANSTAQAEQAGRRTQAQLNRLGRQARPVEVTLHQRAVQQMRSTLPETFGGAHFVRRSKATVKDYYLFGLNDLPSEQVQPTRFFGEYLDAQNQPLASTNQRYAARSNMVATGEHLLLAVPRNHRTGQTVSELNRSLQDLQQTQNTASAAQAEARGRSSALQEVIDSNKPQIERVQGKAAYRALNGRAFPVLVLMLELWNIKMEINAFSQTKQEKGIGRAALGAAGAYLDLAIAMESLAVKLAGNESVLATARRPVLTLSEAGVVRIFGAYLAKRIPKSITPRLIGQTAAGLIFVGLNLYDTWYAWQLGDDAMYGYGLMAMGGMVGVFGSIFGAGGATFLGLGPAGWVALALIVAGAGLAWWLSSTPLEDWLLNGPFGESGGLPHMHDPKEAFYRLLGLFADLRIMIGSNPSYEANAKLDAQAALPYQVRSANTLIRIESNLPGLVGNLGALAIRAECRLRTTDIYATMGVASASSSRSKLSARSPKAQRVSLTALELFFDTPSSQSGLYSATFFDWAVRAQFRLADDTGRQWLFPSPAPRVTKTTDVIAAEATQLDAISRADDGGANAGFSGYIAADFEKIDQPFWADEQTHGVTLLAEVTVTGKQGQRN